MNEVEVINLFEFLYPSLDRFEGVIKVGTFFSGIGSPEKAFKRLKNENIIDGYEVMFFCEINKQAAISYCAIHNEDIEKNLVDITKIKGEELPICHIWIGGFPCQDISNAGKQKGFDLNATTRSSLGWEMLRLIKEVKIKPQFIIFENVANITSKKFIRTLLLFINDLEAQGYMIYCDTLNAKDYDIPQARYRFFLIAILGEYYFSFPRKQKLKYKLIDFLDSDVSEKYYLSSKIPIVDKNTSILKNKKKIGCHFVIYKDKYLKGGCCGFDKSTKYVQSQRLYSENGSINTLTASSITEGSKIVVCTTKDNDFNNVRVRMLTPIEAWRLMGFDDQDFELARKHVRDTSLYYQAGNSIVVNVMYYILRNLLGGQKYRIK